MTHRYSSAFSHLILAGTGIYCLTRCHSGTVTFPCVAYVIVISNSILGVWRWGNPDHGHRVEKPYNFTGILQSILVLPFIVTEVWLKNGMQKELAYIHCLAAVLPFTLYLANRSHDDLNDVIIGLNCISLGILSYMKQNYYGIAAGVSYLFNHFWLREGNWNFENVPVLDMFNYGLCFFCYFALRAISGGGASEG